MSWYHAAVLALASVPLVLMWLYTMPYISRDDMTAEIDPHKVKRRYRVTYNKCVRARYWWPRYVVGYYRWYWQANIVAALVFFFNEGNVNIWKKDY